MTTFGMPLFLEDRGGRLTASEFVDIYDRARFSLRCTHSDSTHAAYTIYNMLEHETSTRTGMAVPDAVLDFGANHALGSVKIGRGESVPMNQYLSKVDSSSGYVSFLAFTVGCTLIEHCRRSTGTRKFVAANGQEYRWSYRSAKDDQDIEWQVRSESIALSSARLYPDFTSSSVLLATDIILRVIA